MRAPDEKALRPRDGKSRPAGEAPTAERRLKGEAAALARARLRRDQARDRRGHPRLAPEGDKSTDIDECERRPARFEG